MKSGRFSFVFFPDTSSSSSWFCGEAQTFARNIWRIGLSSPWTWEMFCNGFDSSSVVVSVLNTQHSETGIFLHKTNQPDIQQKLTCFVCLCSSSHEDISFSLTPLWPWQSISLLPFTFECSWNFRGLLVKLRWTKTTLVTSQSIPCVWCGFTLRVCLDLELTDAYLDTLHVDILPSYLLAHLPFHPLAHWPERIGEISLMTIINSFTCKAVQQ